MAKTPEEIKKGLWICNTVGRAVKGREFCKRFCPYMDETFGCGDYYLREDALAYIQQLEAQVPRWIPVEERLPEDGEDVAAIVRWSENSWDYGVAFRCNGKWLVNAVGSVNVTHWMPLPQPPKEEKE